MSLRRCISEKDFIVKSETFWMSHFLSNVKIPIPRCSRVGVEKYKNKVQTALVRLVTLLIIGQLTARSLRYQRTRVRIQSSATLN